MLHHPLRGGADGHRRPGATVMKCAHYQQIDGRLGHILQDFFVGVADQRNGFRAWARFATCATAASMTSCAWAAPSRSLTETSSFNSAPSSSASSAAMSTACWQWVEPSVATAMERPLPLPRLRASWSPAVSVVSSVDRSHQQHGDGNAAQYTFGHAAQHQPPDSGASVGRHGHKIHVRLVHEVNDSLRRITETHLSGHGIAGTAQSFRLDAQLVTNSLR